jgi:hypothetical protein
MGQFCAREEHASSSEDFTKNEEGATGSYEFAESEEKASGSESSSKLRPGGSQELG